MNTIDKEMIEKIYLDPKLSASSMGLKHVDPDETKGWKRVKRGKGFSFKKGDNSTIKDAKTVSRLKKLAIPPAWTDVWIAPNAQFHIQAIGRDDAGRRQYIYHPLWREHRNSLNFYRVLLFGYSLPKIRSAISNSLKDTYFSKEKTVALALATIDDTAIRVGHEQYYEERESVGLTTLRKEHVKYVDNAFHFNFLGKSGVEQHIVITKKRLIQHFLELQKLPGEHFFQYQVSSSTKEYLPLTADDINQALTDITEYSISAKDFRTWGGTLAFFENAVKRIDEDASKKIIKEMVIQAAEVLGNTPSVAKKHYIHSDLLTCIEDAEFPEAYEMCRSCEKRPQLHQSESELLTFLEDIFQA